MNRKIISRKLYSGLILIGCLLFLIFISAVLMGWDFLNFGLLIIWWSPLFLIYIPIWSIFSEFLGKKYAKKPTNQKVLSLLFHLIGGWMASIAISFYPLYINIVKMDVSSLFLLFIYGCMFALPFWVVDSIIEEKQNEK